MSTTNYAQAWLATLPATSPLLALRRHWLGQSLPEDRATMAACFEAISSNPPADLDALIADPEVYQLAGISTSACASLVIEALHGGSYPTAQMAFAMALDAIDGTSDQWVSNVDEESRWVADFDQEDDDQEDEEDDDQEADDQEQQEDDQEDDDQESE